MTSGTPPSPRPPLGPPNYPLTLAHHCRFAFAQANEVILIDEFDSTFRDVLPFLALPPDLLLERADELREDPNTFTATVKNGHLEIVGAHKDEERAKNQVGLMRRWVEHVDDFNMTMSAHDGPSVILNHKVKQRHIDAALAGKGALLD